MDDINDDELFLDAVDTIVLEVLERHFGRASNSCSVGGCRSRTAR